MLNKEMDDFFALAVEGIGKEDQHLRILFDKLAPMYSDWHHGVNILTEPILVYLVFKQLLSKRFLSEVAWEFSYRCNKSLHSDLALLEEKQPKALIEFKIWSKEDDAEIKKDIEKLRKENATLGKFLFVINFGGDRDENVKYLTEHNTGLKLIHDDRIFSSVIYHKSKQRGNMNLDLFLFQVDG